jgi:hypothetical protein
VGPVGPWAIWAMGSTEPHPQAVSSVPIVLPIKMLPDAGPSTVAQPRFSTVARWPRAQRGARSQPWVHRLHRQNSEGRTTHAARYPGTLGNLGTRKTLNLAAPRKQRFGRTECVGQRNRRRDSCKCTGAVAAEAQTMSKGLSVCPQLWNRSQRHRGPRGSCRRPSDSLDPIALRSKLMWRCQAQLPLRGELLCAACQRHRAASKNAQKALRTTAVVQKPRPMHHTSPSSSSSRAHSLDCSARNF